MKAYPGQSIAIIEGGAFQMPGALAIDQECEAVPFHDGIVWFSVIERHLVLHPRTTTLGNLDPETLAGVRTFGFKQDAKLTRGVIGHSDH